MKRLLKKFISREILSIVIAIICIFISMFIASQMDVSNESGILTFVLAFFVIMLFYSGVTFLCFMLGVMAEEKRNKKKESKKEKTI